MDDKTIKITIIDEDSFFILGLKKILIEYYRSLGMIMHYVPPKAGSVVNILFQSESYSEKLQLHREGRKNFIEFTSFFSIKDKKSLTGNDDDASYFSNKAGEISRDMKINEVLDCLSNQKKSILPQYNTFSLRDITEREWCIIDCFSRELCMKKTARLLNISCKTVSSHKYSIMKKLGFTRSFELYYWIRKLNVSVYSLSLHQRSSHKE